MTTHSKLVMTLLFASLMLSGCSNFIARLLTPNVEQQVASLKAGEYRLDASHTTVLFKVQHMGLSTYVGRFNEVDATLSFDPENIAGTQLDAVVEIGSLDINDDGLKKDLMKPTWFDQTRFQQARFSTLSTEQIGQKQFLFTGNLNWRGRTNPVSLNGTFHGGAQNTLTGKYTLGFSAVGKFKRSDFGMDAYIPLVGDEITLEVYAEFQRQ